MNQGLLARFDGLRTHQDDVRARELQLRIAYMDRSTSESLYAGSARIGHGFIMDSPGDPACVVEVRLDPVVGDSVVTLYHGHPIFNNRGIYMQAREDLIRTVEDFADAGPQGVAIHCPIRKRPTHIRDLALMQLIQIVNAKVRELTGIVG